MSTLIFESCNGMNKDSCAVLWMFLLVDVFIHVSLAHFLSNIIHQHECFVDVF